MNAMLPRRDDVLGLLRRRGRALTVRELAAQLEVDADALPGFARFVDSLAQEGALRWLDPDRYTLGAPGERTAAPPREPAPRPGMTGPDGGPRLVGGTLRRRGASSWLEADDEDLPRPLVLRGEVAGREGDAAVARLERYPAFPDENPEGCLLAALGPAGTRASEEAKVLRREGLEFDGSPALDPAASPVLAAGGLPAPGADGLPAVGPDRATGASPPAGSTEVAGGVLLDLEGSEPGELSWRVSGEPDGFVATIALAAVSRLVEAGSPVDLAAQARGRALELPGHRRALWPAALAAQAALRPGDECPCLGVTIRVGLDGALRDARFAVGWTRPLGLLGEAEVDAALTGPGPTELAPASVDPLDPAPGPVAPDADRASGVSLVGGVVRAAAALADRRRQRRTLGDAVLLGSQPARVRLRRGEPRTVERREESAAEHIASELAGLVDEAAAGWLLERGLVAIFRERGAVDGGLLARFEALAAEAAPGLVDRGEGVLASALVGLTGHPRGEALLEVLRRALGPVRYGVAATDAGRLPPSAPLAAPLRRHADVEVQRVIEATLRAEQRGERRRQGDDDEARLAETARRATRGEARAGRVEAGVLALHRALVMAARVGEIFEGTVVDVSPRRVAVALDEPFVEVQVPVEGLGADQYDLDAERMRLFGQRTGDSVSPGDRLSVVVESVDVSRRRLTGRRPAGDATEPEEAVRVPAARTPRRPGWRQSKIMSKPHTTGKSRGR